AGVVLFYNQATQLPDGKALKLPGPKLPTYPIEQLLALLGLGLAFSGIIFVVLSATLGKQRAPRKKSKKGGLSASAARNRLPGRLPGLADDEDDVDDEEHWDDEGTGAWDNEQDSRFSASNAFDTGYFNTGYQNTGYTDTGYQDTGRSQSGYYD